MTDSPTGKIELSETQQQTIKDFAKFVVEHSCNNLGMVLIGHCDSCYKVNNCDIYKMFGAKDFGCTFWKAREK